MSNLIKHSHTIYMDEEHVDGLLTRFKHEIAEHGEAGEWDTPYYVGGALVLYITRYQEQIRNQDDFMQLFAAQIRLLDDDKEAK